MTARGLANVVLVCSVVALAALGAPSKAGAADAVETGTTASARTHALVRARARHVRDGAITVDGRATEPAWREAPAFEAFVQQDPDEGRPASEGTSLRVVYDDRALFVLVEARDTSPAEILGQLTRRDADSASDWVHVWLDTHEDERTAYRFSVNAAGVKQDARVFDENQEDVAWDGVWDAATTTSSTGWTAELRIPFSVLRYDETRSRWGLQARRDLRRRNEKDYLAPIPRGSARVVSWFGKLDGLDRLPTTWDITAVPYLRAGLIDDDGARSLDAAIGGEGRVGLGSAMNLDIAVNPDFGQVEADPSNLNLGPTEVYFEEKRPFFIEGRDLLRYQLNFGDGTPELLYYSRRVGQEAILGAAKVTGKSSDGWSLGVLESLSAKGDREPLANVAVLRLAKDLREGKTTIGLLATHQIHALDPNTRKEFLRNAGAGGLDLSHRMGDYELTARVYGTILDGSPEVIEEVQRSNIHYFQRPDAPHLGVDPTRTSLSGWGSTVVIGRPSGENWRFATGVQIESPGLDPNPLGYMPNADHQFAFAWGQIRNDKPSEDLRRWVLNGNLWGLQTFGHEVNVVGGNINGSLQLPNYAALYVGAGPQLAQLDPTALRGGPSLKLPDRLDMWCGGRTDERGSVVGVLDTWLTLRAENSGWIIGGQLAVKLHPTPALEISILPSFEHVTDDAQYVDTLEGRGRNGGPAWIIGHLERDTASLALRTNWTLNPNLSVQLYLSPYLSAGHYRNFREVVAPRADTWDARFALFPYEGQDKFLFGELRSNLVFRWEYALGSTLFFVWSHGQTSDQDTRGVLTFGRDLQDLLQAPANDTVMVKLAHWLAI